jgi:uncharacterized membrane protein
MSQTHILVAGGIVAGYALAGLFFLRYWRDTSDRLFLIFALAFWVLALMRIALTYVDEDEIRTYLYWGRFLAFVLILGAILDKNRRQ